MVSRKLLAVLLAIFALGFLAQIIAVAQVPTMPPASSDSTSCIQDSSSAIQENDPSPYSLCHWECILVGEYLICYWVCLETVEGPVGPPIDGP